MENIIRVTEAPEELKKFIELASDPDVELKDIDRHFGWEEGESRRKIQAYPLLKSLIKETKIMALKALGVSKADAYRVYKDAMSAESVEGMPEHDVRMKAADRVLALYGERVTGVGGGGVTVAIQNNDNRVMTVNREDVAARREILMSAINVKGEEVSPTQK
jgi:galactokinase